MTNSTITAQNQSSLSNPRDDQKHLWDDLHHCHALVKVARTALSLDETPGSVAYATLLELVEERLMRSINTLDNLLVADIQNASRN